MTVDSEHLGTNPHITGNTILYTSLRVVRILSNSVLKSTFKYIPRHAYLLKYHYELTMKAVIETNGGSERVNQAARRMKRFRHGLSVPAVDRSLRSALW